MNNSTFIAPKSAEDAIAFALDNLQGPEVANFLKDFREGKSLDWWVETLTEDHDRAAREAGS